MELREIPIGDVCPDKKNPRKDFGDIKALAESCMLNAINPGEPVNPIVVVQDGGIYRIVDGERRYKAMKANKLARCHAVVCEDMDEANSMVAMLATDDKQQLSDVERSRGVQQMLLLGVDPAKVERVGRMAKGSAAKLARARGAVDDAGDDMTLDRMLAIAEFAEAGDMDAVEELTNCRESEWREKLKAIERERGQIAKADELRKAAQAAGVEVVEEDPDGLTYLCRVSDPGNMASTISEHVEDGNEVKCACVSAGGNMGYYYDTPHAKLYGIKRENDDEADPDAEARRIRIDEVKAAIASASASHLALFNVHLGELDLMPNVMGIVEDYALSGYDGIGRIVDDYEKTAGAEVDRRFCPMLAVYGWSKASLRNELPEWIASYLVDGELPFNYADRAKTFIGWLAAFESDGYEPTPADLELKRLCEAALGKYEEEEEE